MRRQVAVRVSDVVLGMNLCAFLGVFDPSRLVEAVLLYMYSNHATVRGFVSIYRVIQ